MGFVEEMGSGTYVPVDTPELLDDVLLASGHAFGESHGR
jgi:hypothetical protein